jgi:hypothetical protein
MAHYIVAYETDRNDREIAEHLYRWKGARVLGNVWLLEVDWSADQLRQSLKESGGEGLKSVVVELPAHAALDWATEGIGEAGRGFLHRLTGRH